MHGVMLSLPSTTAAVFPVVAALLAPHTCLTAYAWCFFGGGSGTPGGDPRSGGGGGGLPHRPHAPTYSGPPNLRYFKIDKFTGEPAYPGCSANFTEHLQLLHEAIQRDIVFYNSHWTDNHRFYALLGSLGPVPKAFYTSHKRQWTAANPNFGFYDLVKGIKMRGVVGRILGVNTETKAYDVWVPNLYRVVTSRNVQNIGMPLPKNVCNCAAT
ncbi:hypothetical protein ACHHYP_20765 [Achlya hypogyna]|uniref:Secreted protein n=1 Tax=Achlya hypogyna TaxID=1202772 RepID=A0A1V9YB26_ACHHY|nr:hypothetical protein ACHHYP_20765 [Achlya hypogyna]